jgi:GxxExxY protein
MKLVDDGHGNLTYRIIGACIAVHNDLGPGHREVVYQRALTQKFNALGIQAESEPTLSLHNSDGTTLIHYRPDFRIEHCIWLEIKALSHPLTNDQVAQVVDYFAADTAAACKVALLVNFGRQRLEWKRLFPPKKITQRSQRMGQRIKGDESTTSQKNE